MKKDNKKNRFRNRHEYPDCTIQGGSWNNDNDSNFQAHYHFEYSPDYKDNDLGFRCVSPEDGPIAKRLVRIK